MIRSAVLFLLASLNVGGLIALVLAFGRGHWQDGLTALLVVAALNTVGAWLLREG